MKRVSSQGKTLSSSQRRHLELQARMRLIPSPLRAQVEQTIRELDERKEQGAKPDKQYFHVSSSHGTVSVAEWMGY
ncbi:hypothetical protein ABDX87_28520 [Pseudomonas abietaniphila]|uniref:hypothetical protein n=1 Tax=Pseudomonas abietaniphila TaxID=89065 RepID=UPI003217018D